MAVGQFLFRLGMPGDAQQQAAQPAGHFAEAAEELHRSVADRATGVGDQLRRIDAVDVAETVAGGAGALRTVEAKQLRLGCRETRATLRAGEAAGEHKVVGRIRRGQLAAAAGLPLGRGIGGDRHEPVANAQRKLDGIGQAAAGFLAGNQPIDDHVDRVLDLLFEGRRVINADDPPVDAGSGEALPHEIREEVAVLPLGLPHQRSEHHHMLPAAG